MKMPSAFFKNMLDTVKEAGFATFQPKQVRFLTGGERKLSRPVLDRLLAKGDFAGPFETAAEAEAYQGNGVAPDAPAAADASDVNHVLSQDAAVDTTGAGQADPVVELPPPPAPVAADVPETSPEATQAIVDGIAAAVLPPVVDELPPPPAPAEVPHAAPTALESAPTAPTETPTAPTEPAVTPAAAEAPAPALAVAAEAEEDEDDGLIAAAKPDARKGAKKKG
jgi:hypothetical protein